MTKDKQSLVVVEESAVFDGEMRQEAPDDQHLKNWLDRAMTACQQTPEISDQVEQIETLVREIQIYRKNYAIALGYLLTYMQDTRLYKDAGFDSLQNWCSANLGIPNSDRITCMTLYKAAYWMQQIGYTLEQATDTDMTPVKADKIVKAADSVAQQMQTRQEQAQYKKNPEKLQQLLIKEQQDLVAKIETIRSKTDQELINEHERRIGALEKKNASLEDIRVSHGQIQAILSIPAESDAAELLARGLKGAFNVVCRTREDPMETFNISELGKKILIDEEF